jgi:hypothetical protein
MSGVITTPCAVRATSTVDIVPTAHVDGLLFVLHRMPRAVRALILVLPVHALHINVLRIAVERRESPRHVIVVPCYHQRQAPAPSRPPRAVPAPSDRSRTRYSESPAPDACRSTASRARSPSVDPDAPTGSIPAYIPNNPCGPIMLAQMQQIVVEHTILRLIQRHIGNILLRRRDRRLGRNRRPVPPRSRRIQGRSQRRSDTRRNSFPLQLLRPVLVQHLHHAHHHQHGIHRLPRLRLIHQQPKLRRQPILMRPDERIHSARIIVEQPPVLIVEARRQPFRRRPHGQHPLHPVVLHQLWPQNLRGLARRHPPRHVHLP